MATIKSFTDLEQSKKLAEILPLESADMYYSRQIDFDYFPPDVESFYPTPFYKDGEEDFNYDIPCWSLAALLNVLPKGEYKDTDLCYGGYKGDKYIPEWFCSYEQQEPFITEICHADNPVDACYEMILKLHELNLL